MKLQEIYILRKTKFCFLKEYLLNMTKQRVKINKMRGDKLEE